MGFDLQKLPELNIKQFSTTVLNAFDLGTMLEVGWLILALGGATTSHANATR